MQINRYYLKLTDYQTITIPSGYHVLSAAPGRDTYNDTRQIPGGVWRGPIQGIDLWVKVTDSPQQIGLGVYLLGTGHPYPTTKHGESIPLNFIGTCVMENGLVWHVHVGPVQNELEV